MDANEARFRDQIAEIRKEKGKPGMTAGEFAQLLPDYLRGTYWRLKIEEYFARELRDEDYDNR